MSDTASFPHPSLVGDAAPFWEAAREGRLVVQACTECGAFRHPPRPACARCRGSAWEWRAVSGRGELWSFTTIHPPTLPAFADRVPYTAIVVRLEEGPFLVSTLVGDAAAAARIGSPVEVVFERVDDTLTLPLFRFATAPDR